MRSQYSASSMKWVVTMTVTPLSTNPLICNQNCRLVIGSTPEVGSSRNRTSGSCINAQAMARRCLNPSGNCPDGLNKQDRRHAGGAASYRPPAIPLWLNRRAYRRMHPQNAALRVAIAYHQQNVQSHPASYLL